jgi:hypothetical protein
MAWFGRGLGMTVRAPVELYRFFSGQMVYHWAVWIGFVYCIQAAWQIAFSVFRRGFTLDVVLILLFTGLLFTMMEGLEALPQGKRPVCLLGVGAWPGQAAGVDRRPRSGHVVGQRCGKGR